MIRVGDAAEANSTCNYGIRSRIRVSKARESLACLHPYKCVMSYQNSGELHSKKKKKIRLIKSRHLLRVMDDEGKIYSFKVYRLFVTKPIF